MGYLKNHWWKRWIRRRGCKLAGGPASVGKRTTLVLEERVELGHLRIVPPRLEIGAYSYVRSGTDLSLVASIGRFCSIGSDCFIGQEKHTHPSDWVSSHPFQHTGTALRYEPALSYAEIGHDVWIGHSAMVMEGVKVGTGAIIATRAVVTRDVPPYAIVAGTPAQVIRYRHPPPEIIEGLLASRWWELDSAFLTGLPLDRPREFLAALEAREAPRAAYRRMTITRQGCRLD
ncbi:CatB-related O-acetyltransferase [Pseudomonas aeruginosa]